MYTSMSRPHLNKRCHCGHAWGIKDSFTSWDVGVSGSKVQTFDVATGLEL